VPIQRTEVGECEFTVFHLSLEGRPYPQRKRLLSKYLSSFLLSSVDFLLTRISCPSHVEGHSTVFGTGLNYVALRLLGVDREHPVCVKARAKLHQLGTNLRFQFSAFLIHTRKAAAHLFRHGASFGYPSSTATIGQATILFPRNSGQLFTLQFYFMLIFNTGLFLSGFHSILIGGGFKIATFIFP